LSEGLVPVHHALLPVILYKLDLGLLAQFLVMEHLEQLRDNLAYNVVRRKVEHCNQFLLVFGIGDDALESLFGLLAQVITRIFH